MNKIKLPEEMMPDEQLKENAKKIDEGYVEMFEQFCKLFSNFSRLEVIDLMSMIFVERLALLVGNNINDYDKNILRGVVERHITEIVFVE